MVLPHRPLCVSCLGFAENWFIILTKSGNSDHYVFRFSCPSCGGCTYDTLAAVAGMTAAGAVGTARHCAPTLKVIAECLALTKSPVRVRQPPCPTVAMSGFSGRL